MERVLEMLVERVEQAVTESPEEKQDGDEGDWEDGLPQCELGSFCAAFVVGLERPGLEEGCDAHGG